MCSQWVWFLRTWGCTLCLDGKFPGCGCLETLQVSWYLPCVPVDVFQVGVAILQLGSSDSPQMSMVLVTVPGLTFSLVLFQPYNYHLYMKLNAVLYHTISFLGARHLISIIFFCLLSTANMSISPFPEGCYKLIVLKPREDSNTSKAFKTKPRGHILGCFCPTSQPSFSPSLSKINTCLAKLADRLKCLCLKPFLWKTWHLRSNVWWKRVWTKMLVCELAGADRLCWGGKLQRKEGRWGQMVALLRSWDATQRFTKVGLSKPKCLNLPEKKIWCFCPCLHSARTSVYLPTNGSGTVWNKWLPTPPWLFARPLSFKIQLRAAPAILN